MTQTTKVPGLLEALPEIGEQNLRLFKAAIASDPFVSLRYYYLLQKRGQNYSAPGTNEIIDYPDLEKARAAKDALPDKEEVEIVFCIEAIDSKENGTLFGNLVSATSIKKFFAIQFNIGNRWLLWTDEEKRMPFYSSYDSAWAALAELKQRPEFEEPQVLGFRIIFVVEATDSVK